MRPVTMAQAPSLPVARRLDAAAGVVRRLAVPALLYGASLVVMLASTLVVGFPANEGSAYYAAVAGNLAKGRGLVIDALWSYATPPLSLPRPAFELWQPLASLIAAVPMVLLGNTFDAAQVGGALTAALLAPLAWLVAREAAPIAGVRGPAEVATLAVGSAALVIASGPLLTATALPDSTVPFAVAAVAAALALARVLAVGDGPVLRPALLLGGCLGVSWLARHEAIWLGLAAVMLAALGGRLNRRFVGGVALGGLAVVSPWLLRSWLTFGTPLPGQTIDNALLTANEQIFAYTNRPSLAAFLDQGADRIVDNIAAGFSHNVAAVLLVPAAPAVVLGVLGAVWLMRRPGLPLSALGALLLAGALSLLVASLVFPVASLWGTFQHAALPLLVGLAVAAVLGLDRLVRAIGQRRRWQRRNAWLAPLALVVLSLPLSGLQLAGLGAEADRLAERSSALAAAVLRQPEVANTANAVVIADHPIWLAQATGVSTVALPAEPLASLLALAEQFDARLVAIDGERGAYPALLRSAEGRACFDERADPALPAGAALFVLNGECPR